MNDDEKEFCRFCKEIDFDQLVFYGEQSDEVVCHECLEKGVHNELSAKDRAKIYWEIGMEHTDIECRQKMFRESIVILPTADSYSMLAQITENINEAEVLLNKALALDPFHITAFHSLPHIYAAKGELEKAFKYINENKRVMIDSHLELSLLLRDMGKRKESEASFVRALKHCDAEEYELYREHWMNKRYWEWPPG